MFQEHFSEGKPSANSECREKSLATTRTSKSRERSCAAATKAGGDPQHYRGHIIAWEYDMSGHATGCVDRYLELANMRADSLKKVDTPCIDDHQIPELDFKTTGALTPVAAIIVLKALFLARVCRPDLLWTVNALARMVTKWSVACDKRLHRLISYIHHTAHWALCYFVGDPPADCKVVLYSDASFGGDLSDSKSTSGAFLCLVGPHTFVPLTWICKKQGAVSHSSTEAEIIALDAGVRVEGIPCLMLWQSIVKIMSGGQPPAKKGPSSQPEETPRKNPVYNEFDILDNVDFVPQNLSLGAKLT